jgi:nicotinamidase-related amidase
MLLERDRSVVVVIDFQGKLAEIVHEAEVVLEGARRLLRLSGIFEVPVLLTEQYPAGIGPTEASLQEVFDGLETPTRKVEKTSFGCCGEPGFEAALSELLPGVAAADRHVVIAGIETHICVVQTVLELLAQGTSVFVCQEAVSSRGAAFRRRALDRMRQAGAVVSNHESVGFEWARDKGHPGFREMNRLLREGAVGGDVPD